MNAFKALLVLILGFALFSCKDKQQVAEVKVSVKFSNYTGNLSSGTIKKIDSFPSKYVRPRRVDIWLPSNYSKTKKYAVLYMHDGQMLFDAKSTWNKQEWKVDEWKVDEIVGDLIAKNTIKNTIVVAIWNHSDIRHSDYYPNKPFDLLDKTFRDSILKENKVLLEYGFQADNYLKFIVEEVKPVIDNNFSTLTTFENTFISGSSMGGLISMYALCEYPTIFGGAACLSTHWLGVAPMDKNPIPASFFTYLEQNLPTASNHKIYFDYGTETLDKFYLPFQYRVNEVLQLKGYDSTNSKNLKFEGHDHSENSWNQRFQIPVEFLLNKK
jgi:hypothetical protein